MGLADFMRSELVRRQKNNPGYSLRAYARDLACDHSSLSQFLRGKREFSKAQKDRIIASLHLGPAERAWAEEYHPRDARLLKALEKLERPSARALARSTKIPTDEINISLARLMRFGIITMRRDRWLIEGRKTLAG